MSLQILHKQLDESTPCPLCQAAMFWVDAEQYDKEINFHECSHCQHRVFSNSNLNCHCDSCLAQRKKILKETRQQEQRKTKNQKDIYEFELGQLSFMQKLFLLAYLMTTYKNILSTKSLLIGNRSNILASPPIICFKIVSSNNW